MAQWAIAGLLDHPEWLDLIVEWQHAEWLRLRDSAALSPVEVNRALHERRRQMSTHLHRDSVPTTLVAHADGQPLGSVSLVRYPTDPQAKHWLTNLYVQPAWRGRGIGAFLLAQGEAAARNLGLEDLWLYSFDATDYYLKLGWRRKKRVELRGLPVEVLHRVLNRAA